ncbi:MAG: COX15/CtaA family protein [Actinomycetes bacterium]
MDQTEHKRRFTVSAKHFTWLAFACAVAYGLIIVSGGAVRLTGSGLGCPNWPACYDHQILPQAAIHPLVEFGNRMVTGFISIVTIATVLAAYRRVERRKDLILLSWALLGGIVAESVWGAVVVYTKLNPYTVMVHFLVAPIFLGLAILLVERSRRDFSVAPVLLAPRAMVNLSKVQFGIAVLVVALGTAVSNAGPHAGNFAGQEVVHRLNVDLRTAMELHSASATVLIGFVLATVFAVSALGLAKEVERISTRLIVVVVIQGTIGVVQYVTHLPTWLVELHIAGSVFVLIGVLRFHLALNFRPLLPHAMRNKVIAR